MVPPWPSRTSVRGDICGSNKVVDQDPEGKYARDLTAAAREGKLDPVIGRDNEVRWTIQILSRRTKDNPNDTVMEDKNASDT
ncbi:hypothetical protein GPECTOR_251g627 [Gonium pectorale]|uniref:Uncharacterized protein n=1 Tax=Gonium pectorale TaxID=33097 RepID=A0A150FWB2_GONPE|nr:hypothetical protein GPECTOR_251g627 [Gonium pectorale]|eukprot:KXZ41889.1 hypothetical protein GPECTOR_251g627 [Gonium pectorale]